MYTERIELELLRHPSSPAFARRAVQPLEPSDEALVVVGSLVSYAVFQGLPPITLSASRIEEIFWVEVCDARPDLEWSGEGVLTRRVLDVFARHWDVEERAPGKCVWALVA